MTRTVVVVGGGIVGAFAAYYLTELGAEVLVVDPGKECGRASANNPGGLNPLHGPGIPGSMAEFAMRCYRMHLSEWPVIAGLSRTGFRGRVVTRVILALAEDEASRLMQMRKTYEDAVGFTAEWLDGAALASFDRRITKNVIGGLLTYGNASVEAASYNKAVLEAALDRGAVMKRGRFIGVEESDGLVRRVLVGSDLLPCDQVVFATGPWVQPINAACGAAIPVRPVRGQLLLAGLTPPAPDHDITWQRFGIYHESGDSFWLGGTFEEAGLDGSPTESGRQAVMKAVSAVVPELAHVQIRQHVAGLRPMTPDGLPIFDRVPGYENAWLALGGGSKGMLLSSGLGKVAAEMAAGSRHVVAPTCFSLSRFADSRCPRRFA